MKFSKFAFFLAAAALVLSARHKADDWIPMFDGSTLEGWKANQRPESWTVKNGAITGDGPASHLFWMKEKCVNCEFKADVKINHGGNSGMYFRTAFGPGFPKGYESQVDNTHSDPVRTGSLYNFVKVFEQLIPDDTWWTQHIIVEGNHIQIFVNDKKTVDFTDEKNSFTDGYLALQQHNAGSVVEFKNLMMRHLPPPASPLSGTWKLIPEQSKFADAAPKQFDIRVLDERDGIRWQSSVVNEDGKKEGVNFFARVQGYDYLVSGGPDYDHISLQDVGRKHFHEIERGMRLRKKLDDHVFEVEKKLRYKTIDRSTYTVSADGKTLTIAGDKVQPDGKTTVPYSEVFDKVE
jgi:3-keto-disaccharide hydrolase